MIAIRKGRAVSKLSKELVNPATIKFYKCEHKGYGRYMGGKPLLGRNWLRAHIVYAWHNFLTLAELQLLLKKGWCIHHKDDNPLNDSVDNLELILHKEHSRLHSTGRNHSLETKQKISATKKGVKRHPELVQRLAMLNRGRKASLEARQKMSLARRGKKRSPETKQRISEAMKRSWLCPEYRQKVCEGIRGKTRSLETRRKISAINKGRKHSLETRQKMSLSKRKERHSQYRHDVRIEEIVEFLEQGTSCWEIGKYLQANPRTIKNRLEAAGYIPVKEGRKNRWVKKKGGEIV